MENKLKAFNNEEFGDMVLTTLVRGEGVIWLAKLIQREYVG